MSRINTFPISKKQTELLVNLAKNNKSGFIGVY